MESSKWETHSAVGVNATSRLALFTLIALIGFTPWLWNAATLKSLEAMLDLFAKPDRLVGSLVAAPALAIMFAFILLESGRTADFLALLVEPGAAGPAVFVLFAVTALVAGMATRGSGAPAEARLFAASLVASVAAPRFRPNQCMGS